MEPPCVACVITIWPIGSLGIYRSELLPLLSSCCDQRPMTGEQIAMASDRERQSIKQVSRLVPMLLEHWARSTEDYLAQDGLVRLESAILVGIITCIESADDYGAAMLSRLLLLLLRNSCTSELPFVIISRFSTHCRRHSCAAE